jgi:nucleoside-diphosphate-sugar epimerase
MKVLVTGAAGFLGRRIVDALQRNGDAVRALVRPGKTLDLAGVEVVEGDVADLEAVRRAVQGVDGVVHAAARVRTTGPWEEFAEANVRGTRHVIGAARAAGCSAIVHVSSLSVYAVPEDGVRIREESPYESEAQSRGGYSRSKLAADRLALYEARRGAPVIVLRPGLLYGPGKRPAVARQNKRLGPFHLLLARRGYLLPLTYVDNVADAAVLALRCKAALGRAFTIVDGNVKQSDYIGLYRSVAGESWIPVYLPVTLVAHAARIVERALGLVRRSSPVTYHQVRRATDSAYFDCSRAHDVLGWEPRVRLDEGLAAAFARPHGDASSAVIQAMGSTA